MNYQLVIQFQAKDLAIDDLVELENTLRTALEPDHDVDGHDMGMVEANIFIFTDEPETAFARIKQVVNRGRLSDMKAAYRARSERNSGQFCILWPEGGTEFSIA